MSEPVVKCGICGELRECPFTGHWFDQLTVVQIPGGTWYFDDRERAVSICGFACGRTFREASGGIVLNDRRTKERREWLIRKLSSADDQRRPPRRAAR